MSEDPVSKVQSTMEAEFQDPDKRGKIWVYWLLIPVDPTEDITKPSEELIAWLDPNKRRYGFDHLLMPPSAPNPSIDGLVASDEYTRVTDGKKEINRLMKINRNGAVSFGMDMRDDIIPGLTVSEYTIMFLRFASDLMKRVNYSGAIRIVLSINKPKGTKLAFVSFPLLGHPRYENDSLRIVKQVTLEDPLAIARALLDQFFNGFGLIRCKFFDKEGKWVGKWTG